MPKETNIGMSKGELVVKEAYISDAEGNKIEKSSSFITLLTDVHPLAPNSSPFVAFTLGSRFKDFYEYKIENDQLDLSVRKLKGFVNENVSKFKFSKYSYTVPADEKTKAKKNYKDKILDIHYAYYLPQKDDSSDKKKIPLLLWFHGLSEGGSNPLMPLMGIEGANLAGDKIQAYFEDGLALLIPQSPTSWLETTEKVPGGRMWAPVDKDGYIDTVKKPVTKLINKIPFTDMSDGSKEEKNPYAATSFYTEPIKTILFRFLAENPQIDRDRIYVGGASAGGYMTMNMMIQSGELFAAAFPVCEYYLDNKITDSQIKNLSEKPLWFTYAKNDTTVNPLKNSVPTIQRLKDAGASNLHASIFENVEDSSGKIFNDHDIDEDDENYGKAYEYSGHYSWIYLLNDECEENGLKFFEWLSRQKK